MERAKNIVTVVTGLPRSGTSLVMQMLRAGGMPILTDDIRRADEDNPEGYLEFERVKQIRKDAGWLDQAAGRAVKIVSPLLDALPTGREYRVLFVERDMKEVLASQRAMMRRPGRPEPVESDGDLARAFGNLTVRVKHWLAERNIPVLFLEHRRAIQAPLETAREIEAFLSAGLDAAAMARVVRPDLYRQQSCFRK